MANGDYGYFGKGDTGYAQYMTASTATLVARPAVAVGTTTMAAVAGETAAAAAASSPLRWWSCWCLLPWEAEGISIAQGCLA